MTRALKAPEALVTEVVQGVRTEITALLSHREIALVDFEAERALLAALLAGYVTHEALPPLEPRHFASSVHGSLWELLRHTTDLPSLAMALREQGHTGAVSEMLLDIECDVPVYPPGYLVEQATRVLDMWRRRTLVAEFRRLAELVSAELLDPTDTAEPLRKIYKEIKA